ncbi:MAG: hypothetical protein QG635_131 [Bacteroidota bacterium]|nr:hypothetical protein [Bacteroidota bacterium]
MVRTCSLVEFSKNYPEISSNLKDKDNILALTQNGKPKYAILNWAAFKEMSETIEIIQDEELMNSIRIGLSDYRNNRFTSIEDIENEML